MGRKRQSFKNRTGVVYSTDESYQYQENKRVENNTIPMSDQKFRVELDKKNRGGKQVTLVSGFIGTAEDLKDLGKRLKSNCGVGGNVKDGEMLIQGDFREKIGALLIKAGSKVKVIG